LTVNRVWDYKAQNPEATIIVRFQHPRQWHQDPPGWARWMGEMVASKWPELQQLDPYVYFANEMNLHYENGDHDAGNQPDYESPEFYQRYAEWVRMTADHVKQNAPEMKLVCPPFAFGHHEDGAPDNDGNPTEGWAGFDYLADTIRDYFDNTIAFHTYWGHGGGSVYDWLYDPSLSSWYAFRWRRVLKLFEHRYDIPARVIIDEAGNFGAADPDFTDQIIYHASECLADERVIAITYFLWEDPTGSPGNIPNSWAQRCLDLDDHVTRLAAMPNVEIQSRVPTSRLLLDDGTVQVMPIEDYLLGVVPAEIFATWPLEALKAQAIASRSYAMYAVQNPRHPHADLCTSPAHCQSYNQARVHPNSSQAVELTAGEVIEYQDQVANAIFSANCGGHTVSSASAFAGAPVPYLRPVPCINPGPQQGHRVGMCQWGAHDMAQRGSDYATILKHYYTGVHLSSEVLIQVGIIRGTTYDQTGRPLANVSLRLSREGWRGETVSGPDGRYTFLDVPAATYSLQAAANGARRDGLFLASGQELVVDLVLELPTAGWTLKIERQTGLPLIIGVMPRPNIEVTIVDPFGNSVRTFSGSKPEYGVGGFETWAAHIGTYSVRFLDQAYDVPMSGQYTRLLFSEGEEPRARGVIRGVLRDQAGRPWSGQQLTLVGGDLEARTVTTGADGSYRFDHVPADIFTLSVVGTNVTHTVESDGNTPTLMDLALPLSQTWSMEVTRDIGAALIAGSLPQAGMSITITDPSGVKVQVVSGSKPDYGIGGFEAFASRTGTYTIQFLDQTFSLQMDGRFTRVAFTQVVPVETQARLVSLLLPFSQADAWLQHFESDEKTRGFFVLEEL
jgi:hypothetical protein